MAWTGVRPAEGSGMDPVMNTREDNHVRFGLMLVRIAGGLSLAAALWAAPALATLDDTLYKADGTPFEGVLMINWKSFEGPGTVNVPTNRLNVRVRAGRLFAKLVPTTTAQNAAYYSVRYVASGSVQFTELWSVPPSETPLRVRDVRIDWPPSTTAMVAAATDITLTDVAGLESALDERPKKGTGYPAPEDAAWQDRVAVIGNAGELAPAAGSPGDCVRVDGSTGPCGVSAGVAGFVDNQAPAGAVDGANVAFPLTDSPAPASSLLLYRNGLLQKQGVDYTLSTNDISFLVVSTPQPGDLLLASYRTSVELTVTYGFIDGATPAGAVDGLNDTFGLSVAPAPAGSLLLHRNGLLQKQGIDYTISGDTVVFLPLSIPLPGDILLASYRTAVQ